MSPKRLVVALVLAAAWSGETARAEETFWEYAARGFTLINRVAVSRDGTYIAVAAGAEGRDQNYGVWNLKTGQPQAQWTDPHRALRLAISPDGKRLVSFGATQQQAKTVKVWDAVAGKELQTFELPGRKFNDLLPSNWNVLFDPAGTPMVTGTGAWRIDPVPGGLQRRAFGDELQMCPASGRVLERGILYASLKECREEHKGGQLHFRGWFVGGGFCDGGRKYVNLQAGDRLGEGHKLHIGGWDAADGGLLRMFDCGLPEMLRDRTLLVKTGRNPSVGDLYLSPTGRFAAFAVGEKTAVYDTVAGTAVKGGLLGFGVPAAFTPQGVLLLRDQNSRLRFLDPASGKELTPPLPADALPLPPEPAAPAGGAPTGPLTLVGRVNRAHESAAHSVSFTPDGKRLATSGEKGDVRIWDTEGLKPIRTLQVDDNTVPSVAYSADGKTLASTSRFGILRLRDPETGEVRKSAGTQSSWPKMSWSADGKLFAVADFSKATLWNADTLEKASELPFGDFRTDSHVQFSPDGKRLFAGGSDGLAAWDVASGRRLWTQTVNDEGGGGKPLKVQKLAVSPDGRLVATISVLGKANARIWDAETGRELRQLPDSHGSYAIAYSPCGRFVVSAGKDRTLCVWDPATGKLLQRTDGANRDLFGLGFSPDGRYLAAADSEGSVFVWRVSLPAPQR